MPSYIKREYSDMYIDVKIMFLNLTLTSLQQLSAASQLLLLLLLP